MEEEDYWNTSDNKAYSFEDVDVSLHTNYMIDAILQWFNIPRFPNPLESAINY